MSMTRSGLHHPVPPFKTIPPWIVLKLARESHFTISKNNHPKAPLLQVVDKILDLFSENTPSNQASQTQVFHIRFRSYALSFAGMSQLFFRRFHP